MLRRFVLSAILVTAGFAAGLVITGHMRSVGDSTAAVMPAGDPEGSQAGEAEASPHRNADPEGSAYRDAGADDQGAAPLVTLPDVSAVAERVTASIVNISSTSVVRAPDPFFSQFFGEEWYGGLRPQQSLGSGVIISPDGYVVTNYHVVSGNVRDIRVVLADKREVHGEIVGRDRATDIAVVRIAARNLPVAPWGDSSRLKVGQWVLAIGSPFQLNQSVTLGIVSAIGRTGVGVADYEDFIQTDAAINPGNSGGALVNTAGQLVGINTAILSESGGYQGIGFAVPSNLARRISDDLVRFGQVQRGSIGGLRFVTLTPELAQELGITGNRGALVVEMTRGSSAYRAGIRPGDVIVGFNGQRIDDDVQLRKWLLDARAGTKAAVIVVRKGQTLTIEVPVLERGERSRD